MRFREVFPILLTCSTALSQTAPKIFKLNLASNQALPSSNSVSQILIKNGIIYLATSKGLNVSADGGATFKTDWGTGGPSGVTVGTVAVEGDTIAVALDSPDTVTVDGILPIGGGLTISTDNGTTWTFEPQSQDSLRDTTVVFGRNVLKALPIMTKIQNVTFSMAFHKGYIYTASWRGSLRRSPDLGKTWQRVVLPPDSLDYITEDSTYSFQLSVLPSPFTQETNYNQYAFLLYSDGDSVLYVGTAGGIDKTTDNGYSWHRFTHQNEASPISGDYAVFITGTEYEGEHYIWAATRIANDLSETSALSYTTDGGTSWRYILGGHLYYCVALNGDVVYGASDDGLLRTSDLGNSYETITNIYDQARRQSTFSQHFYSVAVLGDTVWLSTGDGVATGIDPGTGFSQSQWNVMRSFVPVGNSNSTYFYPNPFSPNLDIGRIHYAVRNPGSTVTIRIYDFSMHVIRTLIQNAPRPTGETEDIWNGKDDTGKIVDNGVYFYSVVINDQPTVRGKIMVLR